MMDTEDKYYGSEFFLWWMSIEALGGFVLCFREFVASGWSEYEALAGAGITGAIALVAILILCGCRVPLVSRLAESFLLKDLEEKFVRRWAVWVAFFALAGIAFVVPLMICISFAGDDTVIRCCPVFRLASSVSASVNSFFTSDLLTSVLSRYISIVLISGTGY